MTAFEFHTTRSVVSKPGASAELGDFCNNLGARHVLVVTDPGIAGLGLHERCLASLDSAGLTHTVFADVEADPPEHSVLKALELARERRIDSVVGFGGGSSMDVAKLIAALTHAKQTLPETYGINNLNAARLPLVQVPTTAGTGSEVTPIAVVTTGATTKTGVVSPHLLPDVALLDAELTTGLPPHVTAATGIDAMVHAIESYTSAHKKNPYSDMLAKEALRLLAANIRQAVHEGDNLQAREAMLLGATLAGQAFANAPVAAVHALAYPLGGHYHIPHGLSNSLVLPHVMRFNAPAAAALYGELAPLIMQEQATLAQSAEQRAEALIEYVAALIADIGLPTTLQAMKITQEELPVLAAAAMQQQRLLVNNPRELAEDDALAIYRAAYR